MEIITLPHPEHGDELFFYRVPSKVLDLHGGQIALSKCHSKTKNRYQVGRITVFRFLLGHEFIIKPGLFIRNTKRMEGGTS
ncbi:MAG: hypothetical protein AMK69_13165 [Nitrospira bacterium SG8_3]|nr:MAG: hypothetical protein AMK69_13165 [Nitrospira bacterium SG8_3]